MSGGPNVVSGRTITKIMHTLGDAPCKKVAQHASPEFLSNLRDGLVTVPCLGCNRIVGDADVADGDTYVEDA